MARRTHRPTPAQERFLEPCHARCPHCGGPAHVAYHSRRTVTTLTGLYRLTLRVRRCLTPTCAAYRQAYRPEEEGRWALPHGEFGLDVIALVGALRFGEHRSVPEIHRALLVRGIQIAERSVTELAQRYEELIALRLADATHLRAQLVAQGRAILAIDGLQPGRGHEVLWVIRDCLSGAVLLARSLLSATQGDLAALLGEVRAALPVAVDGVISDGQSSIQTAVQAIFPGVPHQLCQFHYLREAAKPIFEADRHAKKELKKQVRGVRPLERALEGRDDAEAQAIRGYCLAVRGALTDDGRPPPGTGGLRLHDRLQAIHASIARVEAPRRALARLRSSAAPGHPRFHRAGGGGKGGLPVALAHLQHLLARGLTATADLWPALRVADGWVRQAVQLLANDAGHDGAAVRAAYRDLLATLAAAPEQAGSMHGAAAHFLKVTASYGDGIFQCYDVPDLPPTNNDLERRFGALRYHERRTTGRRCIPGSAIVRGSVRVIAVLATQQHADGAPGLCLTDRAAWHALRQHLAERQETRRAQRRFRKDPATYLSALEQLLQ